VIQLRYCPCAESDNAGLRFTSEHPRCHGCSIPLATTNDSCLTRLSRTLTAAFVTQWKASHPDGRVIDRDLNATAIPPINGEWVGAVFTPKVARSPIFPRSFSGYISLR
jgi:hypothetical protein